MKRLAFVIMMSGVLLAGCASPSSSKSPCVGAPGSPCSHTPLLNEPMEVTT